jgi:putative RNA 2'-phosphotransferase
MDMAQPAARDNLSQRPATTAQVLDRVRDLLSEITENAVLPTDSPGRVLRGEDSSSPKTRSRLIGTLARALRHEPQQYGIELDESGWANLQTLVDHLRQCHSRWAWLSQRDVLDLIEADADERFECRDGRIRALYGHSIKGLRAAIRQSPSDVLYHATAIELLPTILSHGLRPMARSFVHLTSDRAYAMRVGAAKFTDWVLLEVNVTEARRSGIEFYRANRHVWQTAFLGPWLLRVLQRDQFRC